MASGFGLGARTVVHRQDARHALSMKVFDWQRREAFQSFTIPDGTLLEGIDKAKRCYA